jgi:hypothetical protein
MRPDQMTMRLQPVLGGAYTRMLLRGTVPTAVPRTSAARLARELAFWSGWPGSCALSADSEAARWCEWWTDLLAGISARHLELCFHLPRPERRHAPRGDR